MKNSLKLSFVVSILFLSFFSCKKDTLDLSKQASPSISTTANNRGECCGGGTVTVTYSPYGFKLAILTTSGWQFTSCYPAVPKGNSSFVNFYGCTPGGSVLNVVMLPCGGTAPANWDSNNLPIANINNFAFIWSNVSYPNAIPGGYPNPGTYLHFELPIC